MSSFVVSPLYQGISGIAHGGYVAGLAAGGESVKVTLRRPPPLESPLRLDDGSLVDGEGNTVMETGPAGGPRVTLPIPTLEEARSRPAHGRFESHPYPECFMCGTARRDGFGLRVAAADSAGMASGTWTPSGPLLNDGDTVGPEFVWAVVDCLTVWSFADRWEDPEWWPALTGQIQVDQPAAVRRDEPYVVAGKVRNKEGRKVTVDAAVADAEGNLCARGSAVWIIVPENP